MKARRPASLAMFGLLVLLVGTMGAQEISTIPLAVPSLAAGTGAGLSAADLDWAIEWVDAPKEFNILRDHSLRLDAAGHPHLAYGGDFLYYAWHDGTSWRRETVDATPGTGVSAELALDPAGHPHISYLCYLWFDGGQHTYLRYAHYDGAAWQVETVDDTGTSGRYTSIAVDGAGRPHIGYVATDGLRYAYHDGAAWQVEWVAPAHKDVSIAVTEAGVPYIALIAYPSDFPRVAWLEGSVWHIETVEAVESANVSIAIDPADQPHLCYRAGWPDMVLRYAHFDGTAWQVEDVGPNAAAFNDASLVLDAAGNPHLATRGADLSYVYRSGSSWQGEVIAAGLNLGGTPALALDPDGAARAAYIDRIGSFSNELVYAVRGDAGWAAEVVDATGSVGEYVSLALDSLDRPHVSYQDRADQDLKYAYHDGAAWQIETVDGEGDTGRCTSVAVDAAGRPHISYRTLSGSSGLLKYAYHDGSAWQIEEVTSGCAGVCTSLALDAAGRPHIAYHGNALKYAYHDGAAWQIEVVDSHYGAGYCPSLALDSAGRPHVSYYEGQSEQVKYAYRDGAAWKIEIVASDVPAYEGGQTPLALDAAGHPYMAYYDGYLKVLKYAFYDGSSWQIESIDMDISSFHVSLDLVLDAAGRPHLSSLCSCSDLGACLDIAHRQDEGWWIETVDGAEGLHWHHDLTIDGQERLHLAYWDLNMGDLKYARQVCFPPEAVQVVGPGRLPLGVSGLYSATYSPLTATRPVTLTWDTGAIGLPVAYTWTQTGTHVLAVTASNACGQVGAQFSVTIFCQPLAGLAVEGPRAVVVDDNWTYWALPQPPTASRPLTCTWDNGRLGPAAVYSWTTPGLYTLTVTASNACPGLQRAYWGVQVLEAWPYNVYLPLLVRGRTSTLSGKF